MVIKNLIFVLFIALMFICSLYFYLKMKNTEDELLYEPDNSINGLVERIKSYFNGLLEGDYSPKRLLDKAKLQQEEEKRILQKAIRSCSHGDIEAKETVKRHIKNWLINVKKLDYEGINELIPFDSPSKLTAADKFEILLYDYRKEYGNDAATCLISDLLDDRENRDEDTITSEEVHFRYFEQMPYLSYDDRIDIVTNYIYRQYKGHGVIDSLRDMNIDGISAGVSGTVGEDSLLKKNTEQYQSLDEDDKKEGLKNYESVWIFHRGTMVRLAFLSFNTEKELERVCKNVYRYNSPGQLSASKGFIANDMKDGSRVIVVRPPFSESWAFFIRKFGKKGLMKADQLITGPGSSYVLELLKYIISGCQVFAITGEQGCGKTTMLKALIDFIPANYTLRIQELIFELHLREEYPDRNIVSFRETEDVTGREGLDLQKKTDGTVNIIGEVASAQVAGWLVMVAQVASRFTIFTHHAKTTDNLVSALRNDLMTSAGFGNEAVAELQVRQAIRFDVHMVRLPDGSRKIQRITEIARTDKEKSYRTLVELCDGEYVLRDSLSEETAGEMLTAMSTKEAEDFKKSVYVQGKEMRFENKKTA